MSGASETKRRSSRAKSARTTSRSDKPTQAENAYAQLKKMILGGSLPFGSQLLELEAAEMLNVSRTPVREAMVRLKQEGMIELRPRHGMRVLPVSAGDMREIYDVLTALEGKAAELVAVRQPGDDELKGLWDAVADMDRSLESDDLTGWAKADERFHALLVDLAGNARLKAMVGHLWDQAHRARMATLRLRPRPEASNREHRALVEAIAGGDADQARRIHEAHRRNAGRLLVSILEDMGGSQL